ncbi:uncharacterized protein LOC107999457 isoform X2 [Apis cerana]|uniref:uncharacterized protein LOC107999457 isoform X2 n=1 Tax=Apis cerana TaxID=7461 RepID=UPI002B22CDD9|nr:uncharacterized protein LOC107999457 isoform X2 [Apis cerana]
MRLIFIILVFFSGTVLSRYYEKRRFDRSIYDDFEISNIHKFAINKQWTFTDYKTHFKAYKDKKENKCYIEKFEDKEELSENKIKQGYKTFYISNEFLTKLKAWQLAGERIVNFCNKRKIILIERSASILDSTNIHYFNSLFYEKYLFQPPLIKRAKRQVFEKKQKFNKKFKKNRLRRQIQQSPGKFQGQTQSQYLNIGNNNKEEGKAEAEATQQSSRAVVSGKYGMGQAQSMSLGNIGCEDCQKYSDENAPDRYVQIPTIKQSEDTIVHPSKIIPGISTTYSSRIPTRGHIPYFNNIYGTNGVTTYPGSIDGTTSSRIYPEKYLGSITYPVGVSDTITDVTHPGSISSTKTVDDIVYPKVYPGSIPGTTIGDNIVYPQRIPGTRIDTHLTYPGSIPHTATDSAVYAGDISTAKDNVAYSGSIPGTTTSNSAAYPGNILNTATSGDATYRKNIAGITTPGDVAYSRNIPGTITSVVYPNHMSDTTTDSDAIYRGNVPGTITNSGVVYPSGISSTIARDATTYKTIPGSTIRDDVYPQSLSDTTINGGRVITYPIGDGIAPSTATRDTIAHPVSIPGTAANNGHGQIITNSKAIADAKIYPTGQIPSKQFFGILPGRTASETTDIRVPSEAIYSGDPKTTGHFIIGDQTKINANGKFQESDRKIKTDQSGISYPHGIVRIQTPEAEKYPNSHTVIPLDYSVQEQYPRTWHDNRGILNIGQIDNGQNIEQYPSEKQGIRQYPVLQYPLTEESLSNIKKVPQYYQQSNTGLHIENDNSNSQASSSIKQTDLGTQASASAQGKFGQGTAQSQVTGTYSGSGSFSAQAGSTDINKSAQTEINGNKEGAVSNAQAHGGYGKSQAQVQLNSELGTTTTGAQSSGWNHGTNSQVQASSKGGIADAQANGEGNTSSQAQIGFQPYLKTDEKIEKYLKPFHGGGTASAQSGTYTGQSQSQLEGSFQYGITYTGAAQAGSGSGAAASRKPFNFNLTNTELFKSFKPSYGQIVSKNNSKISNISLNTDYKYNQDKIQSLQTSSSSQRKVIIKLTNDSSPNIVSKPNQSIEKSQIDDTVYDDYEEEYDGEDYISPIQTSSPKISQIYAAEQNNSNRQSQTIQVASKNQYNFHVKQNTNTAQARNILQPGQSLSGYTIPPGFRGRVTSIAGSETIAHGNGKSQSQTVSLIPKESSVIYKIKSPISEIRSLKTNHEKLIENHNSSKENQKHQTSTKYTKATPNISIKPSYYTITNSVAGKIDDKNSQRKYEHRYYTKSSTCGYFTFSCNIVYGSNGRTKICKPKMPTYSDGTPMKC